jgi:hypothetical protein
VQGRDYFNRNLGISCYCVVFPSIWECYLMFSLLVHLRPQDAWKSVCFYLLMSVGARCELAVVIGCVFSYYQI